MTTILSTRYGLASRGGRRLPTELGSRAERERLQESFRICDCDPQRLGGQVRKEAIVVWPSVSQTYHRFWIVLCRCPEPRAAPAFTVRWSYRCVTPRRVLRTLLSGTCVFIDRRSRRGDQKEPRRLRHARWIGEECARMGRDSPRVTWNQRTGRVLHQTYKLYIDIQNLS